MTMTKIRSVALLWFVLSNLSLSLGLNFKLHGINYSLRKGADWYAYEDRCKSYDEVVADLTQLKAITDNVRVFSITDCNTGDIMLRAVQQVGGLGLWLGMWIGPDGLNYVAERDLLSFLLSNQPQNFASVQGLHVSSEAIYREDLTVPEAIGYRNEVKAIMVANKLPDIPVVIADIIDNYIQYPELVTVDNVVHFNQFPFWERTTDINNAAVYMQQRVNQLQNVESRQIVIGETGWADAGSNPAANPANAPSMRKWLRDFVCLARSNGWQYYWFIAYDSDWQRVNEQDPTGVEGHFGIFDENGNMKPFFESFSIDCSQQPVPINPNSSTFAPTPPVANTATATPFNAPTHMPTKSPTTPPTKAPATATPVAASPIEITSEPTVAPTFATGEPTESPSVTSGTTSSSNLSAQCQDHPVCNALLLSGQCCPSVDGWMLACCEQADTGIVSPSNDGPTLDKCDAHAQCRALGLADACCPTPDNVYLDCCEVVPNDCFEDGSCTVYSAVKYAAEQRSGAFDVNVGICFVLLSMCLTLMMI